MKIYILLEVNIAMLSISDKRHKNAFIYSKKLPYTFVLYLKLDMLEVKWSGDDVRIKGVLEHSTFGDLRKHIINAPDEIVKWSYTLET